MVSNKKVVPVMIHAFNKFHEADINALIPIAESRTRARMKGVKKSEERPGSMNKPYNHCFESQFFHEEMNKLTRERGLRSL